MKEGHIKPDTEFGRAIRDVILQYPPERVVETGTHVGLGSTLSILKSLMELEHKTYLTSIEISPVNYREAWNNLRTFLMHPKIELSLRLGCSLSEEVLPTKDQLDEMLEKARMFRFKGIKRTYFNVVNAKVADFNLLAKALHQGADIILLDSAGHLGFLEFMCVMNTLANKEFILMLDDIYIVKHSSSVAIIANDPRFTVLRHGSERSGYCIVKYNPGA